MLRYIIAAAVAMTSFVLAGNGGNVGACYSPFHLRDYPANHGIEDHVKLQYAIHDDFKVMSKHFTHVRTYYSQYFGTSPARAAAAAGVKLYLGVYMNPEYWWLDAEVDAAIHAVKDHPGTVEAILRITEYMDWRFDNQTALLAMELDILGVNIYPFFSSPKMVWELNHQWEKMKTKFPLSKMLLTETGHPTAGEESYARVSPGLHKSIEYYHSFKKWSSHGNESIPKFWFMTFDRTPYDKTVDRVHEHHFGFFTHDGKPKALELEYPVTIT
ncbi:TPA: hypothetical protein N0F65_010696 [Lagenidium giganteum]|uniref:glucan endo-1,3-beta-D-glucosidase n=1 Tax=Lagenidium giganteum TaxID=4803 RepID=A0AAV2Z719_9STRA|nr:TPA: hypothetical protein N0F65_010696 [Lagenidium giganteum]